MRSSTPHGRQAAATSGLVQELSPRLLHVIFCKRPDYVAHPERGRYLLGLHGQLSRSSYTLGVRDGKDIVTYQPQAGDDLHRIRRGAIAFASELGLHLLTDQTLANISLQSGIGDSNDPAEIRACKEVVIHVQERDPRGPIAEVRRIASGLKSHWIESAGFNSRLLAGSGCTIFDCVAMVLSPFGVVREDLHRLIWRTPAAGFRNIRRQFFLNNPDLMGEIIQTECPARFRMMTRRQLDELRLRIARRMTRANFVDWRIDGYRHVKEFRGLSLREVGERCFRFMSVARSRVSDFSQRPSGGNPAARGAPMNDRRTVAIACDRADGLAGNVSSHFGQTAFLVVVPSHRS